MSHPSNWIKVRFEQIVENVTDRIDKPSESGLEYYIGLDHIDTDQIRIKRFGSTADVNATKFLCKKGDIIFGKRNSYLRKVGVTDRDAVVSAHSMVLRPTGDLIDPDFLPCFLQSSTFWRVAHSVSEGSMSPTIKWKIIGKQEFIIPPIEEQKKIAKLLWAIEDNIEKTEKLIAINEKLKKGLLDELLTKGIGHAKFKETEIGEIPEDWELLSVSDLISRKIIEKPLDGNHGSIHPKSSDFVDEGIPFIMASDLKDGKVNLQSCKFLKKEQADKLLKGFSIEGDVLLSHKGTVGRTAIVQKIETDYIMLTPQVTYYRVIDNTKLNRNYLKLYFESRLFMREFMRLAGEGATRVYLGIIAQQKLPIILPSIKDQEKIVKVVGSINGFDDNLNVNLKSLSKLKKKLTDDILKGEVKV